MNLIAKIGELDAQFLIIASVILIAKFSSIIISNFAQNKANIKWLTLLSNQPYKLAILMYITYAINLAVIYHIELFGNYLYAINPVIAIVNFILSMVIVLEEEKLCYSYFKQNVAFDNQTLIAMMPLIRHSIRLSFIIVALLILFPINIFPTNFQVYMHKFISVFIIWVIAWLVSQLAFSFETIITNKSGPLVASNFQARSNHTRIKIVRSILVALIIVISVACTFMVFKKAQTAGAGIFASAGLITAIIGFSAQKSMGNLIAGVQIAINEPIKLNDTIVIEGEYGTVEEISLTYVVVKIWDLRRLIVPINYFTVQPFVNLTRSSTNVLCPIIFYTDYSLPVDKVRDYFIDALKETSLWDGEVATFKVIDATEQTLKVRALASARTADDSSALKYEMYEQLIKFINTNFPECLPGKRIIGNGQLQNPTSESILAQE